MKIPTDNETKFMEPMTDEAIEEYAAFVVGEMDAEKVISGAGMEFITREGNVPNEEDQEKVLVRIEELYNALTSTVEAAAVPEGEETGSIEA